MQDHPIPQDIVGYRFHIIGNMTIIQFIEVALGVGTGFVIFYTNLVPIVKWPLILISASLGFAMAFLPIQERPLRQWIIIFFRTLYKPTKYYWKREAKIPAAFKYKAPSDLTTKSPVAELNLNPIKKERIYEYINSVKNPQQNSSEAHQQQNIINLFKTTQVSIDIKESGDTKIMNKPNLQVDQRALS